MAEAKQPVTEPVAVVGLGCRLPGDVHSPDDFWDLLYGGRSAVGTVPDDRWQGYAGFGPEYAAAVRRATRHGSFLSDIEGFDAEFFGLTPREAELMDPQQRILLEVAWSALEHAGIPPRSLAGDDVGVFVGVGSDDYGRRLLEDLPRIEAWTGIGAAMCAVANRISYALDLRGPSLAVDTACSASLVAMHLACQSLRQEESTVALVGGVNLIVSPGLTLTLDAAGAMAPDGRSKSFDASADGYGRGEGCGVLVLKRLSDARRDGDRVLAVVLGSAVNQDGRTNGIMAPSAEAQRHLIARACRRAGVEPATVGYVEAHGTGTRLGDPLEVSALSAVYGVDRPADQPCLIGSVKSNIGHLEAGAGVASLIKAVLALRHGTIPASLNHVSGNPAVDWATAGLRVVTEPTPWPQGDRPRRAGVSGFGYGGTIAHVVLEEAPTEQTAEIPEPSADTGATRLYPLSAASPAALCDQAAALAGWLTDRGGKVPLPAVGHTLALRRSHLEHRAAVVAAGREELVERLRGLAADEPGPDVATGSARPDGPLVWVFSGHGSQWAGMGRELLDTEPVFAAVIDELEPVFAHEIGFSPREILEAGDLGSVDRIQTMIFAMQVGLAAVWRSVGVTPDAVIGHSVGEIAAAVTAGVLSLADGARLICRRSLLLREVTGRGAMAMVSLPFEDVRERLGARTDVVAAIMSSPLSTVVAGDTAAVEELVTRWQADDVPVRRVASDVAFHSPHMDPLLGRLAAAAADLEHRSASIPVYRTAVVDPRGPAPADGDYWSANLRNPVRLKDAVRAAADDGYRRFVEISPHPVVTHSIGETLSGDDTFVGGTLRRNLPERAAFLAAAGALYASGAAVDWALLQPAGDLADLPGVAWQHRRQWWDGWATGRSDGGGHDVDGHALLGPRLTVAGRALEVWRTVLTDETRPYPGRHAINDVEIVPAAVLLQTFLRAASATALADVAMVRPLVPAGRRDVQVVAEDGALRIASRSAEDPDGTWLVHATATGDGAGGLPAALPHESGRGLERVAPDTVVRHLASVGVPTMAFGWTVTDLWRGPGGLRGRVRVEQPADAPTWAPVLDAVLSAAPLAYPGDPVLRTVVHVGDLRLDGPPPADVLIDVAPDPDRPDAMVAVVATRRGRVVGRLADLRYATMESPTGAVPANHLVHTVAWRPFEAHTAAATGRTLVLVAADATTAEAARRRLGPAARVLVGPDGVTGFDADTDVVVVPGAPAGEPVPEVAARNAWLLAEVARRLATGPSYPRLWCLTTGVAEAADSAALAQAPLWGLGRVIGGEHPEIWGGVVDLDPSAASGEDDLLARVLAAAPPADDVLKIRSGEVTVARLAPADPVTDPARLRCRPDGTYLVTGGLGVLGIEVARWLAGHGARRVVLAGRSGLPPRRDWDGVTDGGTQRRVDGVRALEAAGVTVRVVEVDVADAAATAAALDPDALGLPPVRGVVHAAGVLDNRLLSTVDEPSLRSVLRPKVDGAWTLHTLFPPGSVDFLVFFSSCGYLLGLPGQASYGSANAYLDALAVHRGAGTWSFGWTSWRGQGMAVNDVVDRELRARGVADIAAEEAFAAWDLAHGHGGGHFPVLRTVALADGGERPPVLYDLANDDPAADEAAAPATDGLADLAPDELRLRLVTEVGDQIATEMRLSASVLDPRRSLAEQGLDSVMTLAVRRRLEKRFGRPLPATLLWHQPTVTAIADHLADLLSTP